MGNKNDEILFSLLGAKLLMRTKTNIAIATVRIRKQSL